MATKLNPGKFDCYANAKPDEPMFILLARDPSAPDIVEQWAHSRMELIGSGAKPLSDLPMVKEALDCAKQMRTWRENEYLPTKRNAA